MDRPLLSVAVLVASHLRILIVVRILRQAFDSLSIDSSVTLLVQHLVAQRHRRLAAGAEAFQLDQREFAVGVVSPTSIPSFCFRCSVISRDPHISHDSERHTCSRYLPLGLSQYSS